MMPLSDPKYMCSRDLLIDKKFQTARVTIEEVIPAGTLRYADKTLVQHDTLKFVGKEKMLVLCSRTNQAVLHFWSGDGRPEKWVGMTIVLKVMMVESFGDLVPAIRIIPPADVQKLLNKNVRKRLGTPAVWTPAVEEKQGA